MWKSCGIVRIKVCLLNAQLQHFTFKASHRNPKQMTHTSDLPTIKSKIYQDRSHILHYSEVKKNATKRNNCDYRY